MNRSDELDRRHKGLTMLNANLDASILDEDAWEDATDVSGVDREMLSYSQRGFSTFDSAD